MAMIEGDIAKASALAIRTIIQNARAAPIVQDLAELNDWLTKRADWFLAWKSNSNGPLSLEYVQELNDWFGPPMPGRENMLQAWAKGWQPQHIHLTFLKVQNWLDEKGLKGLPKWTVSLPPKPHV